MSAAPWVTPVPQFFANDGTVLAGGKLYTYAAGGTTNQATYTTSGGGVANTNPVVMDSAGRPVSGGIWLAAASYRFDLFTSAGVLVWSVDNVTGSALSTITTAAANKVYAGPTGGASTTPAFRSLVAADIPSLTTVYADAALDNLASVSINTSLLAQTGVDLGSTAKPFRHAYLWGSGTFGTTSLKLTGTPTGARVWTFPDTTDTVVGKATTDVLTNKTLTTPTIASFVNATHDHSNAAGGGSLVQAAIQPILPIFAQTASVTVANSSTETSVIGAGQGSMTIPANFFTVGKSISFRAVGVHSASASPTIRWRFKIGVTTVLDTTAVTSANSTNAGLVVDVYITCRTTGAGGTVFIQGNYTEEANATFSFANTAVTSINTTITNLLDLTVEWGTGAPGNTVTITNLVLRNDV